MDLRIIGAKLAEISKISGRNLQFFCEKDALKVNSKS